MDGLAVFCAAITRPEREGIVIKLAARGLDRAALVALGADADALARAGRNVLRGVEATTREPPRQAGCAALWSACSSSRGSGAFTESFLPVFGCVSVSSAAWRKCRDSPSRAGPP